jgi:hypothetical protein
MRATYPQARIELSPSRQKVVKKLFDLIGLGCGLLTPSRAARYPVRGGQGTARPTIGPIKARSGLDFNPPFSIRTRCAGLF